MKLTEFKRGDTFELPLSVTERGENASVVPVDISNWVFSMVARENSAIGRVVHTFRFDAVDAINGTGVFTAAPDVTKHWPVSDLVFDISVTDQDGKEATSPTVSMQIVERITR